MPFILSIVQKVAIFFRIPTTDPRRQLASIRNLQFFTCTLHFLPHGVIYVARARAWPVMDGPLCGIARAQIYKRAATICCYVFYK